MSRRATGIWRSKSPQDDDDGQVPLPIQPTVIGTETALKFNGTFEFAGIRVKLVTYQSIPGVIQIIASKTISEWNTLRSLNHINIVGFDDINLSIGHWLPTSGNDHEEDPKGICELYILKPPLSVSIAAATAQHVWSLLDAHRICKDVG